MDLRDLEAKGPVVAGADTAQDDDRDGGPGRVVTHGDEDIPAAHIGQHEVEDDKVGLVVTEGGEAGLAVGGGAQIQVGLSQHEAHQGAEVIIVLDEEDFLGRCGAVLRSHEAL